MLKRIQRLTCATFVGLTFLSGGATAQQTPEPVATATAPATTADAAPAAATATAPIATPVAAPVASAADALPARRAVLLVPAEFEVSQMSAGGVTEPAPDMTATARANINGTLQRLFKDHGVYRGVAMPELSAEETANLREHAELFKLLALDTNQMLNTWSKAWTRGTDRKAYTIGNGLKFLAERTGADYAVFVNGAQITQTGGSVFLQFMAAGLGYAMPGGGTFLTFGIVDLHDGSVDWFDVRLGAEMFGMTGTDMRNPGTADQVLRDLFGKYPRSPLINDEPEPVAAAASGR
jgi:hypothetical protein